MNKVVAVLGISLLLLATGAPLGQAAPKNPYQSYVDKAKAEYKANNYNYQKGMQTYTATGDYLNASKKNYLSVIPGRRIFDSKGLPKINYGGKYYYNPVTTANTALSVYGTYLKTKNPKDKDKFLALTAGLMRQQSADGSFRYTFKFKKPEWNLVYQPGWVSAMAQGEALSVFYRAYQLTNNEKYLKAGQASFKFLLVPKSKGGTMTDLGDISKSLKQYIWFEEYVSPKNNYTLNGYMFTLLGIYDWSQLNVKKDYGQAKAKKVFVQGTDSLRQMVRRYDIGGYSTYDLSHLTMKTKPHMVNNYHPIHIYQLHALYTVSRVSYFETYSQKWIKYVQ